MMIFVLTTLSLICLLISILIISILFGNPSKDDVLISLTILIPIDILLILSIIFQSILMCK